jgi:hypothetical protein
MYVEFRRFKRVRERGGLLCGLGVGKIAVLKYFYEIFFIKFTRFVVP